MPTPDICQNAKASLEQVRPLKQAFDDSFSRALSSGDPNDVRLAQEHKQKFLEKMTEVRMQMHAWEKETVQIQEQQLVRSLFLKKESGEPLTKYELLILYEIHTSTTLYSALSDFRDSRNQEEDVLTMFDIVPDQIAHSLDQVTSETRMYVGDILEPNFFQRIPDTLELIYTSFPEHRIHRHKIEIGGKDEEELMHLLTLHGHLIDHNAEKLIRSDVFKRSLHPQNSTQLDWIDSKLTSTEEITLIRLRVEDLGFLNERSNEPTIYEIYNRAEELGLELCPPEAALRLRLQYTDQPTRRYVQMGMEELIESDNLSGVFYLFCDDRGNNTLAFRGRHEVWDDYDDDSHEGGEYLWGQDYQFVFRLRKHARQSESESEKPTT